jgi:iron(II)-dependent oxidoreductase
MTQTSVTNKLERAREETLALVSDVSDADLERQHSPLMSPLVWDLGHIAAFEDLWLNHRHGGLPLLRADLLEVYDAFETPRSARGSLDYLRRAEAEDYLHAVRARTRELAPGALHELVVRHEHQHAETMVQTLNLARLDGYAPPRGDDPPAGPAGLSGLDLVDVAGASFPLGTGPDGFAYDNERPVHVTRVAPFRIGRVPVTNADWLAFIGDGGYARREWWSAEGWAWRTAQAIEHPRVLARGRRLRPRPRDATADGGGVGARGDLGSRGRNQACVPLG